MGGCERLWEIDALREGKLRPKDEESFARHLRTCDVCRRTRLRDERLRGLALTTLAVEPNELALRRLRTRILDRLATRTAPRRRGAVMLTAAATLASLLFGLSSWALVRHLFPAHAPEPIAPALGAASPSPETPKAVTAPAAREVETSAALAAEAPAATAEASSHASLRPIPPARPAGHAPSAGDTPRPDVGAAATEDASSEAYTAAVALFGAGDYASASRAFRAFTERYPADPQVEDATYLDAVALARAGRGDAAGAAAEDHLARFPRSFHRREAAILVARAARDRGDCARARAVLDPWLTATADPDVDATLRACASKSDGR